jgi:hypothetical protein
MVSSKKLKDGNHSMITYRIKISSSDVNPEKRRNNGRNKLM